MKQLLSICAIFYCTCFNPLWAASKELQSEDVEIPIPAGFDKSIERSLRHLAERQNSDGSWKGQYGTNVGENGLIMMAFMSQGNLPGEGRYGHVVAKGLEWMLGQAQASGLIKSTDRAPAMYGHGLATLMLSEVWGQTRRKDVQKVLQAAIDLILRVQGPKGGWGYKSTPTDGDTSVCVMQLFALKSAHQAGMFIPPQVINKALDYIKKRYSRKDHGFGYNSDKFSLSHVGSAAAGACIMQICQETDSTYTDQPLDKLIKVMEGGTIQGHKFYFVYYASVACYVGGPKTYQRWLKAYQNVILEWERKDGGFGQPYQTAFAVLSMSLPYRYIPIYQH